MRRGEPLAGGIIVVSLPVAGLEDLRYGAPVA